MENINRFKRGVKALTGPSRNSQTSAELQMQIWIKQIDKINTQHTAERAQKDLTNFLGSIVENRDLIEELTHSKVYKDQIGFILNFDFAQDGGQTLDLTHRNQYTFKGLEFSYTVSVSSEVKKAVGFCKTTGNRTSWLDDILYDCGISQNESMFSLTQRTGHSLGEFLEFIAKVELLAQEKRSSICSKVSQAKEKLIERMVSMRFTSSEIQLVQSFW